MMSFNSRARDEFLRALEEARRAALADDEADAAAMPCKPAAVFAGLEFRDALDRMAGKVRSYISAGLLARLYNDGHSFRSRAREAVLEPVSPPKSEHEQVVDELCLTPDLTATDLKLLRRRFAKTNHPDRVPPAVREQATRRMTIANSLIDEALRGIKVRAQ